MCQLQRQAQAVAVAVRRRLRHVERHRRGSLLPTGVVRLVWHPRQDQHDGNAREERGRQACQNGTSAFCPAAWLPSDCDRGLSVRCGRHRAGRCVRPLQRPRWLSAPFAIMSCALFRIRQHFIRPVDPRHVRLGLRIIRPAIRVMHCTQRAPSRTNDLQRRIGCDFQDLVAVVVGFGTRHRCVGWLGPPSLLQEHDRQLCAISWPGADSPQGASASCGSGLYKYRAVLQYPVMPFRTAPLPLSYQTAPSGLRLLPRAGK